MLLVGPPGTGKTMLAKALPGESKANVIAVDGSYFNAMFDGAGVSKVKELFKLARKNTPACCSSTRSTASANAARVDRAVVQSWS